MNNREAIRILSMFTTDEAQKLTSSEFDDAIYMAIKALNSFDEWIPCSEMLPEDESIMYWTTHEDGSIVMHGYMKKNGFIYNWEVDDLEKRKRQGDVIAWMPLLLPEPYKPIK